MSFNSDIHEEIIINGVNKGYRVLAPELIRQISVGSMRRRFTLAERVAIKTSVDPMVQVLADDLAQSSFIDLNNPELVGGLNYLTTMNDAILAPERPAQLLQNGEESEKP